MIAYNAFRLGIDAHLDGLKEDACPWDDNDPRVTHTRDEWIRGWRHAARLVAAMGGERDGGVDAGAS